ncbi:hypothetical protein BDZ45DRAFT_587008, partial [Acephala macrosclerotiorum]
EFSHARYSALNYHPEDFIRNKFDLRPALFAKPRRIEIFMAIPISGWDSKSPGKETLALARTLSTVIHCVRSLGGPRYSRWLGDDAWKHIIAALISERRLSQSTLVILQELGVCLSWDEDMEIMVGGMDRKIHTNLPPTNGEPVRAHCAEYTTQLTPIIESPSSVKVSEKYGQPVQAITCLQVEKFAGSTKSWATGFANLLQPSLCVEVESGAKVSPETIYKLWCKQPKSLPLPRNGWYPLESFGFKETKFIRYKQGGLRSLQTALRSRLG